jgi:hypothetical protein
LGAKLQKNTKKLLKYCQLFFCVICVFFRNKYFCRAKNIVKSGSFSSRQKTAGTLPAETAFSRQETQGTDILHSAKLPEYCLETL